ncbi:uncharacterized protein EV420DRAFT_741101 [Desarmillaria tabescens]|uniref:Uncharacterized protein n=1 Tax=Armillaria tabescens TaxID=1929756 RepID=A0AA39JX66_ARMTA|nr:uncharacterized protein EV420DRAFT_741101 [Desarmillaria tabescens]KAK0450577.1 hypothetical protein EV420DRAFT_741101 [Desarmillaria tabescens]
MEKIVKMKLVLELYASLPSHYHVFVGGTIPGSYYKIEKIMKRAATDIRPSLINRIKANAAEICDGVVPLDCFGGDLDRHADPLCRQLVGYEPSKENMARLCPCLYEPGKKVGGDSLFRSPAILKILVCILWGASGLRTSQFQTKTTYAGLWSVTEVTPAAIAFAAITLRFLLSGDPSFTSDRGAKSKINYFSDYEFYVSVIEKKLAEGSKSMSATVQLFNEQVFPTSRHVVSGVPTVKAGLEENPEEEAILRGLDEVEAEIYSDESDFDSKAPIVTAHSLNLQADSRAVPTLITESVGATASVPLAQPGTTTSNVTGGKKKIDPDPGVPACCNACGRGLAA